MRRTLLSLPKRLHPLTHSAAATTSTPPFQLNPPPSPQTNPHHRPLTTTFAPSTPSSTHPHRQQNQPQSTTEPSPSETSLPKTYFSLFPLSFPHGAPPASAFTPDLRTLRSEYLRLQAVAHPDRHHGPSSTSSSNNATTAENLSKESQDTISANINSAYKTLQSPLLRAQYLLQQHGIDIQEEGSMETDNQLLMEVLEAREEIEAAVDEEEVENLKEANRERVDACVKGLEDCIKESRWQEAGTWAVRLRYWTNIGEGLEGWERGKKVVLGH